MSLYAVDKLSIRVLGPPVRHVLSRYAATSMQQSHHKSSLESLFQIEYGLDRLLCSSACAVFVDVHCFVPAQIQMHLQSDKQAALTGLVFSHPRDMLIATHAGMFMFLQLPSRLS